MKNSFTLIETIIALFIFILAVGAISVVSFNLYRTKSYSFQQSQAIFEARKGIANMTREIREISQGDDGSFPIEEAEDNEFIFYADINHNGNKERVRYFISPAGGGEGSEEKTCQSSQSGGNCSVSFDNFLGSGVLESATLQVSVDGDLNSWREEIDIYADGNKIGTLCEGWSCAQCKETWQDLKTFDVTDYASDGEITLTAQASSSVDPICNGKSFQAKFNFSWKLEGSVSEKSILKKGVIEPVGWPPEYPSDQEKITVISRNVMNNFRGETLFTYYDKDNNLLPLPARVEKTTFMCFKVIVNVDPNKPPRDFNLSSCVQIRNLKAQ